ncbi:pseudouridine synthase [Microscilla marina]|uniref:Pseudouridine synthase n=1 Tax=Microscilla marina ATCC 23134 TaxID=313606 RepID=A1ZI67_MICM2|nr:pseudouridine synthase [Microscilla marina]EAY29735.1 ribosomal large subunit pseudouridine synthase B [Microscilla marina ATCC 23134]
MNKKRNDEVRNTSGKNSNGQSKHKNIDKKKVFFSKKDKRDRKPDNRRNRNQEDNPNPKFKSNNTSRKPKFNKDAKFNNKDSRNRDRDRDNGADRKNGPKDHRRPNKFKQPFQKRNSDRKQSGPPNYDLQKPGSKANKHQDREGNRGKERTQRHNEPEKMRLNRFISNSGVCSRREADKLIEMGMISVNGKVITEMGFQVSPTDTVKYGKRLLKREKFVYVLLNKPKDFITTTNDPQDRKTVMDLIKNSCDERIYPVGRLDRNTTGLLLFTNDGEVAKKLSHPSHDVKKVYQVELDKPLKDEDLDSIAEGVILEDGYAAVDEIAILNPERTLVGVEIHIGRNRIVRRIFNHLDYEVVKLDRTMYAGLNKKNIDRGDWRYLSEKEVIRLKYFA